VTAPPLDTPGAASGPRLAWFSPMPPSSSGIAAYSAEVLPYLRARGLVIDVFVDPSPGPDPGDGVAAAHDFVWRHRRAPYDLVVYQLGNASCHDYMWGYLFRYPGLVVLHDGQVHQARAQDLLARWTPRRDDYLAEFAANHPDAPPDIGRLIAEGLGGTLFGHWPLVHLLLRASRLAAVHSSVLGSLLTARHEVAVRTIPMGVADPLAAPESLTAAEVRARYGLGPDHLVIGAFGGLTPEKRLPQVIDAVTALASDRPGLHLLLVGTPARHYDVAGDAVAHGIADRVHFSGYVPDAELAAHLAAADICACLRWPTTGETSASWLRAIAAGRATVITDLAHQAEVPVAPPRGWRGPHADPVAVAVPILDEAIALRVAFDELARSRDRRAALGAAARAYWRGHHTLDHMADAYMAAIGEAMARPAPQPPLPFHLRDTGGARLTELLAPFGVEPPASLVE
jgi:glycosyltransferase involved in cell wall biosynthesis